MTPGQKLIVPHEATVLMAARTERPVPVAESRSSRPATRCWRRLRAISNRVKVIYEVKRGDTLASIARLFKTTVASIKTWNKIPGNRIAPAIG